MFQVMSSYENFNVVRICSNVNYSLKCVSVNLGVYGKNYKSKIQLFGKLRKTFPASEPVKIS
jgi:hypothetical protein